MTTWGVGVVVTVVVTTAPPQPVATLQKLWEDKNLGNALLNELWIWYFSRGTTTVLTRAGGDIVASVRYRDGWWGGQVLVGTLGAACGHWSPLLASHDGRRLDTNLRVIVQFCCYMVSTVITLHVTTHPGGEWDALKDPWFNNVGYRAVISDIYMGSDRSYLGAC